MKRRNLDKIKDAAALALASQVKRTLAAARVQGWSFPEGNVDVGVSIVGATPLAIRVKARLADVVHDAVVSSTNPGEDILRAVDGLVEDWLAKHATKKPGARLRRI